MTTELTRVSDSAENFRGVRIIMKTEGEVLDVENIPPGVEIEVHQYLTSEHLDYLIAENALDDLEQDENGAFYSVWIGRGE